eukprot:CAMPEP_0172686248 /NCGR_PEP_ID=MMETSP1074-20121228/20809_1 /TAXON_ID=2916 /ORGANISM="Ceratium fusus, Strain PA161109" /LENGTH=125 /DNA_ID=CAMNT_0013505525 /DNA_START=62 /DNA_END=439 /DNA_ORIENTATION=+
MDLKQQPISAFLPLLNRVVEASFKEDAKRSKCQPSCCLAKRPRFDARESLRVVAHCLLTQQQEVFLKVQSRSQMEKVVERLSTHVLVNDDLLVQVDKEIHLLKTADLPATLDTALSWLTTVFRLN